MTALLTLPLAFLAQLFADALKAVPGVTNAVVNLATEKATVQGTAEAAAIVAAIANAGYEAKVIAAASGAGQAEVDDRAEKKEAERRELTRDFTIAAVLTAPVFILEMGSHLIPGAHDMIAATIGMQNSWYLQFVLTTLVLFVPGIRARAAAWTHAGIAVVLLSVLGANWGYRLGGYEDAVLPYGILMSAFAVVMVGATGWHGGRLVFDYHLGTSDTGN